MIELRQKFSDFQFKEAEGYLDEELRIDIIVVANNGEEVGGIQVKPLSFNKVRQEIITFNQRANYKWGKPVFYLFYDGQEEFVNLREVVEEVKKLT